MAADAHPRRIADDGAAVDAGRKRRRAAEPAPHWWYAFCRFVVRASAPLYRVRSFGRENVPADTGALVVCNHQSFADPMVVGGAIPRQVAYMARASLFAGVFGRLLRSVGAFPVRRGEADLGATREALRRLRRGELVMVFPEGTRSRDGSVGRFHSGFIALAERANVPIVPAAVCGAHELWPRHRLLPWPGTIWVGYDKPIPVGGATGAPPAASRRDDLGTLVRERIVALHRQLSERRLRCLNG